MVKSLALIFINIIIGSVGQLMFKSGMMQIGRIGIGEISRPWATLGMFFTNPYILLALPLYVVALVIWLIVLSRLQLSFAYPCLSWLMWLMRYWPKQSWESISLFSDGLP